MLVVEFYLQGIEILLVLVLKRIHRHLLTTITRLRQIVIIAITTIIFLFPQFVYRFNLFKEFRLGVTLLRVNPRLVQVVATFEWRNLLKLLLQVYGSPAARRSVQRFLAVLLDHCLSMLDRGHVAVAHFNLINITLAATVLLLEFPWGA